MIIPYSEIHEILNGSYIDDGEEILTKHSAFNGEREFALVLIEQCMGLLSREVINELENRSMSKSRVVYNEKICRNPLK